jgi:hypothetical protein
MSKKYRIITFVLITFIFSLFLSQATVATDSFGLGYGDSTGLGSRDVRETVASIISVALGLLGIIALVGIIYGGFVMMTSGGNEEKSGSGRKAIISGIIGLAIILSAYAITSFVLNQLADATSYGV